MFKTELRQAGHVRRFTIRQASGSGWEVREEEDSRTVRSVRYDDWHRVERALHAMRQQVLELEESGWQRLASC